MDFTTLMNNTHEVPRLAREHVAVMLEQGSDPVMAIKAASIQLDSLRNLNLLTILQVECLQALALQASSEGLQGTALPFVRGHDASASRADRWTGFQRPHALLVGNAKDLRPQLPVQRASFPVFHRHGLLRPVRQRS